MIDDGPKAQGVVTGPWVLCRSNNYQAWLKISGNNDIGIFNHFAQNIPMATSRLVWGRLNVTMSK